VRAVAALAGKVGTGLRVVVELAADVAGRIAAAAGQDDLQDRVVVDATEGGVAGDVIADRGHRKRLIDPILFGGIDRGEDLRTAQTLSAAVHPVEDVLHHLLRRIFDHGGGQLKILQPGGDLVEFGDLIHQLRTLLDPLQQDPEIEHHGQRDEVFTGALLGVHNPV